MTASDRELRMRARQVIVTTSLDTHRAIPVPTDLRDAIERGAKIDSTQENP